MLISRPQKYQKEERVCGMQTDYVNSRVHAIVESPREREREREKEAKEEKGERRRAGKKKNQRKRYSGWERGSVINTDVLLIPSESGTTERANCNFDKLHSKLRQRLDGKGGWKRTVGLV